MVGGRCGRRAGSPTPPDFSTSSIYTGLGMMLWGVLKHHFSLGGSVLVCATTGRADEVTTSLSSLSLLLKETLATN